MENFLGDPLQSVFKKVNARLPSDIKCFVQTCMDPSFMNIIKINTITSQNGSDKRIFHYTLLLRVKYNIL